MILNRNLRFSENQAITATTLSTDVIQWPANGTMYGDAAPTLRNIGAGTPIPLLMQVTANFNTLTSLTISIETANDAALSSGAVVLSSSGAIPLASLVAGFRPSFSRFIQDANMLPFLGLRYTVIGTNPTLGMISAYLATEVQSA